MSDLHLSAQTTSRYGLPLNHLEYTYVEKCTDVKELEKILRVLRSGDEGRFPDLESFTEKRLESLCPKSRALRKENPITRLSEIGSGDHKEIAQDLKDWTSDMNSRDNLKTNKVVKAQPDIYEEGDENLPPVRSSNIILEGKKRKDLKPAKSKKKTVPRDYREWDKVNIDEELEKVDEEDTKRNVTSRQSSVKGITDKLDGAGLSEEEKVRKADREKDKGNEAYRSGDFEESVTYYSRSISLMPTTASYNNRALAYLKMEKWDKAIKDCNFVLNLEKENVKALLRRGTAYKSKNQLAKGKTDFEKVLALEPNNKKAESLLKEVDKELEKESSVRKDRGRRMVIEEVEEDEEEEEIEVEKPMVNGFSHHKTENVSEEKVHANGKEVQATDTPESEPSPSNSVTSKTSKTEDHSSCKSSSHPSQKDVVHDSSPVITEINTKQMCSQSVSEATSSTPLPASQNTTSAFEQGDSVKENNAAQQRSSPSASSSSSETADEQSRVSDPQALPSSTAAEDTSSPTSTSETSQSFTRPVLVQKPLPVQVTKLKGDGNNLFRSGQYDSALQIYSRAIALLEKDSEQTVNLSLLLSNRAACNLKTGNSSAAVSDCARSLELVPHSLKSLLRRGAAYESFERYGLAYVDYKHALSIDRSVDQAHQGASRCQRILTELHGSRCWREKIPPLKLVQPWEVPLIVDPDHQSSTSPSPVPKQTSSSETSISTSIPSAPSAKDSESHKTKSPPPPSKEAQFEKLKAAGNLHVQKGEYSDAEVCYTSCIALCPEQVACYTNRALCYLKLNKPMEAESDCDKALSLQSDNPKALYRRALARKMLHRYKLSMQDLLELLKLEPKNKAANAEMDIVKQCYKEELEQLKQKKQESDGKVRKRLKIEEVDDEDDEDKTQRSKAQVKSQSKSRGGKSNQPPSVVKSKGTNQSANEKKQAGQDTSPGMPVAPPSAPRLMKTTPYEFCQAWNSLKPTQGIQPYAEILRQILPPDLPSVISNKLDGQMLQIIVRCVYEEMVLKGEVDKGYQILDNLCKVPRFSTVSMFLSGKEKKEVSSVLDILGKTTSAAYSKADVLRLKKEYSVK